MRKSLCGWKEGRIARNKWSGVVVKKLFEASGGRNERLKVRIGPARENEHRVLGM
jgi:hypothetical protein